MQHSTERNRGFVLVTSLIFLAIVTLLAVTAMNSTTLQEKMARNARARTLALQAANGALRQAEALLASSAFDSYQPVSTDVSLPTGLHKGMPGKIHIWRPEAAPARAGENRDNGNGPAKSTGEGPVSYVPYMNKSTSQAASAGYYIAEYGFRGRDLNPDTTAKGHGTVIYRITARGQGADPSAIVVTQSRYVRTY